MISYSFCFEMQTTSARERGNAFANTNNNNTFCGCEIRHFLHYCEMSSRFPDFHHEMEFISANDFVMKLLSHFCMEIRRNKFVCFLFESLKSRIYQ